ncbi:MAG TPA: hypothetical protein DCX53_05520 [Anaerolineae bacterium]|nr:hypothetical protein [Anaerolineae bacterium]
MRLLFLTNFYPPASRGGYEQWCQEIADGLRERGHDVLVLTSQHGRDHFQGIDPSWVRRELHLEMEFASMRNAFQFFTNRKKREKESLTKLQQIIDSYTPDATLIWGMWNFPRSLPALAEKLMPGRVAYYIGDYWLTLPSQFVNYWNAPARNVVTGLPKLMLKPFARKILAGEERPVLNVEHALFPSAFMRGELERRGVSFQNTKIIYGAIDTSKYLDPQALSKKNEKISMLYIGRITYEKGVHTAIEAVKNLVNGDGFNHLKLTIVGDGDIDYVNELHDLVGQKNIASYVTFLPAQPKEALPALYRQSDIFLFTSIWAEPFGRVIVEAMASGLAVVGTSVGGAAEILFEDVNALVYTPDDSASLSRQLKRVIESSSLREKLSRAGRETAVKKFDIQRMTTEIETYLKEIVHS